jgi:hypothetical protein
MIDLSNNTINDDELEARIMMAEEWNGFKVPTEIDEFITQLYWEDKHEHATVLAIIHEFDAMECYARKCYWFSSANFYIRKGEEEIGAFYNGGVCQASCIPKRFRSSGQASSILLDQKISFELLT